MDSDPPTSHKSFRGPNDALVTTNPHSQPLQKPSQPKMFTGDIQDSADVRVKDTPGKIPSKPFCMDCPNLPSHLKIVPLYLCCKNMDDLKTQLSRKIQPDNPHEISEKLTYAPSKSGLPKDPSDTNGSPASEKHQKSMNNSMKLGVSFKKPDKSPGEGTESEKKLRWSEKKPEAEFKALLPGEQPEPGSHPNSFRAKQTDQGAIGDKLVEPDVKPDSRPGQERLEPFKANPLRKQSKQILSSFEDHKNPSLQMEPPKLCVNKICEEALIKDSKNKLMDLYGQLLLRGGSKYQPPDSSGF